MNADKVDVRCQTVLGIGGANESGNHEAPVSALGDILIVSELEHELMDHLCVLRDAKTFLLNSI